MPDRLGCCAGRRTSQDRQKRRWLKPCNSCSLQKELQSTGAMPDVATEPGGLMAEAGRGQADLGVQVGQITAADVAEFDAFERVPEARGWVQLGRVDRKQLEVQAPSGSSVR